MSATAARRRLVAPIVVAIAALAPVARADIAPPNLRGCEGLAPESACLTDACGRGTCRSYGVCKDFDLAACVMCRYADAGACDDACKSTTKPCFGCVPLAPETDATRTYRFDDCASKKLGDACRTPSCGAGACGCEAPPCAGELACVVHAPRGRGWIAALAGAAALAAVLAAGVLARRRARR